MCEGTREQIGSELLPVTVSQAPCLRAEYTIVNKTETKSCLVALKSVMAAYGQETNCQVNTIVSKCVPMRAAFGCKYQINPIAVT